MIGFGQRQGGQRPRRIQPFQQHGPGPEVRLHQQHSAPAGPEPQRRHLGGEALIRCGQPQRELLTTASDWKYQCVRSVPGITVEREVPSPALLIYPLRQGVQPRAPFVRPAQHGPERRRNGNHEDESITPLQPLTRALCRSRSPTDTAAIKGPFPGSGRRAAIRSAPGGCRSYSQPAGSQAFSTASWCCSRKDPRSSASSRRCPSPAAVAALFVISHRGDARARRLLSRRIPGVRRSPQWPGSSRGP